MKFIVALLAVFPLATLALPTPEGGESIDNCKPGLSWDNGITCYKKDGKVNFMLSGEQIKSISEGEFNYCKSFVYERQMSGDRYLRCAEKSKEAYEEYVALLKKCSDVTDGDNDDDRCNKDGQEWAVHSWRHLASLKKCSDVQDSDEDPTCNNHGLEVSFKDWKNNQKAEAQTKEGQDEQTQQVLKRCSEISGNEQECIAKEGWTVSISKWQELKDAPKCDAVGEGIECLDPKSYDKFDNVAAWTSKQPVN